MFRASRRFTHLPVVAILTLALDAGAPEPCNFRDFFYFTDIDCGAGSYTIEPSLIRIPQPRSGAAIEDYPMVTLRFNPGVVKRGNEWVPTVPFWRSGLNWGGDSYRWDSSFTTYWRSVRPFLSPNENLRIDECAGTNECRLRFVPSYGSPEPIGTTVALFKMGRLDYTDDSYTAPSNLFEVAYGDPRLHATLSVSPTAIEEGEFFSVTVKVFNTGAGPLTDVTAAVEVGSDGTSEAELLNAPEPASIDVLNAGETAELTFDYIAKTAGAVSVSAEASGRDASSSEIVAPASVTCPIPGAPANTMAGPGRRLAAETGPACSPDAATVLITSPDLELTYATRSVVQRPGSAIDIVAYVENHSTSTTFTDMKVTLTATAVDEAGNALGTVTATDPSPPEFASMAPDGDATVTFTLDLSLLDSQNPTGLLGIDVEVTAKDASAKTVRATEQCEGEQLSTGPLEPGCDTASGQIRVLVSSDCDATIFDESPRITAWRSSLKVKRTASGEAIACGGGGSLCKLLKEPREYAATIEHSSVLATGPVKNVGQEVVLRVEPNLPEGKTENDILKVEWAVDGTTIERYDDFSSYKRGLANVFLFTPHDERSDRVVSKTHEDEQGKIVQDWNRVWFFWKDPGTYGVEAKVTIDDGDQADIVCTKHVEFTVERNATDPDRQAEKFYSSCCKKAIDPALVAAAAGEEVDVTDRVGTMHAQLHSEDDAQAIFPGESWIMFHRVIVDAFNAWRVYFGYPPVGMWNGAITIPPVESGFAIHEPSRLTSSPKCGQDFAPEGALCPLPPWFTRDGAVDGGGSPILRPEAPLEGGIACRDSSGELIGPGQHVIDDFTTNRALGCILAKTWHANLHFLISGAMARTDASPWDPVFWRLHNFLSGAQIGGLAGVPRQPPPFTASALTDVEDVTPVYLAWEEAMAAGAPGVSVAQPKAGRPVVAIPTVVVQFWEDVSNVSADDLVVNGSPATALEVLHTDFSTAANPGDGRDYYVFTGFSPPPLGDAEIELLPADIVDGEGTPFAGFTWTVPVEQDSDGDGVPDSIDNCPDAPNPSQHNTDAPAFFTSPYGEPGHHDHMGDMLGDACDDDDDDDGVLDSDEVAGRSDPLDPTDPDACPDDPAKRVPGLCGCGVADLDSDGDRVVDCSDECPEDPTRFAAPCGEGCDVGKCLDVDQICKACGQPVGTGAAPTASDALATLRAAVGVSDCAACVCDVNASGAVTASDALLTLKRAVGQDVELACGT